MQQAQKQIAKIENLKFIQVNLNHCKAANETLKNHLIENKIDIALLQDAHCSKDKKDEIKINITDMPSDWVAFKSKNNSAHIIVNDPPLFLMYRIIQNQQVQVKLKFKMLA